MKEFEKLEVQRSNPDTYRLTAEEAVLASGNSWAQRFSNSVGKAIPQISTFLRSAEGARMYSILPLSGKLLLIWVTA